MKLRVPHPLWILAAAVALAILAVGLRIAVPVYQQKQAIATIERLGGNVRTEPRAPAWLRDLVDEERLRPFDEVTSFTLGDATVHDADLNAISVLTSVRRVELFSTQISDKGFETFCRLPNLEMMEFVRTPLTVVGIGHLNRSQTLSTVRLVDTAVTDSGLAQWDNLEALTLESVKVNDAGLRGVGGLQNLSEVDPFV